MCLPVMVARFDISKTGFFISGGQVGGPPIAPLLLQTTARNTSKKKSRRLNYRLSKTSGQLIWPAKHVINPCQPALKMRGRFQIRSIGNSSENTSAFLATQTLDCKKKTVRHACEFDPVGQTRWTPENNVGLSVFCQVWILFISVTL